MIHPNFNTALASTNKIVPYLMFIVIDLFVSVNVMAKKAHLREMDNCLLDHPDSAIIRNGEWIDPNDSNHEEELDHRVSIIPTSDGEFKTVSHPDNEMYEYVSDWELKKSVEDISIYYQWIKIDTDKKRRRLLGDMIVNAPVSSVVALIKNETRARDWVYGIKNYYHLDVTEENCWYSYAEFRFPWPFPNCDLILRNYLISDPQKGVITIQIHSVSDIIPEINGIKRLPHFRGTWTLSPLQDSRTSVKFIIFTNMNSKTPTWISDPIILNGLLNTMKEMRNLVSDAGSISYKLRSTTGK